LGKDLKASTLDKVENRNKKIEQKTSIEVTKGEKRPLEREMEEANVPVMEQMDKRVRFSGEDNNEQSKSIRSQSIKTINNKNNHSDDDESKEEDDDDDDDNKNRRSSTPAIKIVRRKTNKETTKKPIQRQNDRISSKSSISTRKQIVPIKKKIRLVRKRSTPYIRSSKQIVAAWVKKYNIEDCCIRLDLYDPIYETGRE
jgi:hypothetical protein